VTEDRTAETPGRFAGIGWRSVAVASAAAATGILALVVLSDPAPQPPRYTVGASPGQPAGPEVDPLHAELARCRTLPANSDDARCRDAWEVNRRRFMGESRSYVVSAEPVPIEPAPSATDGPAVAAPNIPAISEH
jgi:conjugative transfer region protein TrbK